MEYRRLGASGLKVPALSFGAGTFGGRGPLFGAWGNTDAHEARRLVDICLDAGRHDVRHRRRLLRRRLRGGARRRRSRAAATGCSSPPRPACRWATARATPARPRSRLITACEAALRRLGTDYIDLFQLHAFDAGTPVEEVLSTLDDLVRAGKVRYVGVSNFSGWQLMKSLAVADEHGHPRYVAHQVYYSLVGRDYEWELMPLGLDQGVGALVWSPLGWGRLTGKVRRGRAAAGAQPAARDRRLRPAGRGRAPLPRGRRPRRDRRRRPARPYRRSPSTGCCGGRPSPRSSSAPATRTQLRQNLGAVGWTLTPQQIARLDAASDRTAPYPYFPYQRQEGFARLNPLPV